MKKNQLFLFWKTTGIATTYGREKSIVSMIEDSSLRDFSYDLEGQWSRYVLEGIKLYSGDDTVSISNFLDNQQTVFSSNEEYGLLNRLDTPTEGMLYFAGDIDTYRQRRRLQEGGLIKKHYYAVVSGKIGNYFTYGSKNDDVIVSDETIVISRPLMHHIQDERKMIALVDQSTMKKGRGNVLPCETTIDVVSYNTEKNQSLLHVMIPSGRRHQIRVHCASLGHPIVGDTIYSKQESGESLRLWSVGVTFE